MSDTLASGVKPGPDGIKKVNEEGKQKALPRYSVMNAMDIVEHKVDPPEEIWGGICLTNDLTEIVGSSGVGKSRIMLNLAFKQITKQEKFLGLKLSKKDLTWLLLGTENNRYRYQTDLEAMLQNATDEQKEALRKHLFLNVLESDADSDMAMSNGENHDVFQRALKDVKPDVLILDPWGDICSGSELQDEIVRSTIRNLRKLREGIKEKLALIIVNHSRMGEKENAKASGLDAANFGKNSKVLYTISRCVWNISYLDNDPTLGIIGFFNAKRSNDKTYPPFVVTFDEQSHGYKREDTKDYNELKAAMLAESSSAPQNKSVNREANADMQLTNAIEKIRTETEKGPKSVKSLSLAIKGKIPVNDIKDLLSPEVLKEKGFACYKTHGKDGVMMVGTPLDIGQLMADDKAAEQREKDEAENARKAEKVRKEAEKAEEKKRRAEEKAAENNNIPKRGPGRPKGSKNKKIN